MIVCGDFIDAQFGVMFGLTTMASAGLGNWLSDTIGLGLGDVIERSAAQLGGMRE
ncbi:Transmembrane protein 65 [Durusdinium trenchii]